jgi:acetyl-CoA C-acetyltransferase
MRTQLPKRVYIRAAHRSPIGKFGGALSHLNASQLAGVTLKAFLLKAQTPKEKINFVYMGQARQAGAGPNPARQATILAGLPESVPAQTVNQACASGMMAIIEATQSLTLGRAQHIIAGGVESMSNTPYYLMKARWGYRMGPDKVVDGMHQDGFFCPMSDRLMGATVEDFLVPEFLISRDEQDRFSLASQIKAEKAWTMGTFKDEVLPMPEGPKGALPISNDEHRRGDTTLDKLSKLSPVFDEKKGTITAGNSSGITDGAAFLHLTTEESRDNLSEIIDWEVVALDPRRMGLGPVESTLKLLSRNGLKVGDVASFELNEAFAGQVLACQKTLKIPENKLNPKGGAIALGHPIGCTGARITTTLVHTLKAQSGAFGIATLCVSGGMGVALLIRTP